MNKNVLKYISRTAALSCAAALLFSTMAHAQSAPPLAPRAPFPGNVWVSAYYISGDADSGRMPVKEIDFTALTELIHFCLFPNADGTLQQSITLQQSRDTIAAAHAAGCRVVVSLGSQDNGKQIRTATTDPAARAALVRNLVQFTISRGYDGIDLDYEPLGDSDVPNYTAFIFELRRAMNAAKPGLLLTAAVASEAGMYAVLQDDFDQINLMTYDNSGKYQDFKSWYNSSLYGDPAHVMENNQPYPSDDQMVKQFIAAGVKPSKLAIGAAFYGYTWTGVSGPRQTIKDVPYLKIDDGADYRDIMDKYYQPSLFHWDDVAKAPYLSIPAPNPQDSKFISYDDQALCAMKVAYARQQGLGGVMIWELGGGYRPSQPEGSRDELLQSVKKTALDPAANDPAKIPAPQE